MSWGVQGSATATYTVLCLTVILNCVHNLICTCGEKVKRGEPLSPTLDGPAFFVYCFLSLEQFASLLTMCRPPTKSRSFFIATSQSMFHAPSLGLRRRASNCIFVHNGPLQPRWTASFGVRGFSFHEKLF